MMTHAFPPSPIHRLEDLIAAVRGLAVLAAPDVALEVADRSDVYFLIKLLSEHLETCLSAIMDEHAALLAALHQAQDTQPTPEATQA